MKPVLIIHQAGDQGCDGEAAKSPTSQPAAEVEPFFGCQHLFPETGPMNTCHQLPL